MKNGTHLTKVDDSKAFKNTRNKLGRRRSTIKLHSLKMELMQNKGMKAPIDFFSHKDQ